MKSESNLCVCRCNWSRYTWIQCLWSSACSRTEQW